MTYCWGFCVNEFIILVVFYVCRMWWWNGRTKSAWSSMRLWHGREEWARSNFWQILRIRVEVNILKILIYLLKRAIRISLIWGIWMVEPWSSLVEGIRTTVSAQSSNVYGMLPHMCCIIDYHLGRYEPPSPSTKKVICSAILSFLQNKTKNSGAISDYIPTEGLPKF